MSKFNHSVKVPRLYKIAAKIAKEVKEGVGSIKHLLYENKKSHPNIKAIYALVSTLFQKNDEIEFLLKRSQFFSKEPRCDPWLTKVLMVELLFGRKLLPGNSKPESTIRSYEQIFKAHLSDVPSKPDVSNSEAYTKPRYVRVNTILVNLNDAVDRFVEEDWNLVRYFDKTNYEEFLNKIASLAKDEFLVDIHIPNLLIFPSRTEFYKHPAYKSGCLILQDKASCLPVHMLNPPPGSKVLDMCAAPGMKTTQLAAVMNNEGTVYATEREPRRFKTLNDIVDSSGAKCITTINRDVLTCTDKDFPGVEYILVDPSCSGSGLLDRQNSTQEDFKERIRKLSGFQIKILRSALTKYPDAKRVVYSTCSVFPEENEDVVRQVLETNTTFKLVPAVQFVNDTWQNFGSSDFGDIGKYCLYAKPNEDLTNGFFVAVFERLQDGEQNQFFNSKIFNFKKHLQSQEKRKQKQQQEFQDFDQQTVNFNKYTAVNKENENLTEENEYQTKFTKKKKTKDYEYNSEQLENKLDNTTEENEEIEGNNQTESYANSRKNKKRKNIVDEVTLPEENKKEKKNKKMKCGNVETDCTEEKDYEIDVIPIKKMKKRKDNQDDLLNTNDLSDKTKKENFLSEVSEVCSGSEINIENANVKKKNKKSRIDKDIEDYEEIALEVTEEISDKPKTKKRKKKKGKYAVDISDDDVEILVPTKKNKKKKHEKVESVFCENLEEDSKEMTTKSQKKKSHKDKHQNVELNPKTDNATYSFEETSEKRKKKKKKKIEKG